MNKTVLFDKSRTEREKRNARILSYLFARVSREAMIPFYVILRGVRLQRGKIFSRRFAATLDDLRDITPVIASG